VNGEYDSTGMRAGAGYLNTITREWAAAIKNEGWDGKGELKKGGVVGTKDAPDPARGKSVPSPEDPSPVMGYLVWRHSSQRDAN
jgi:hypothetical protein